MARHDRGEGIQLEVKIGVAGGDHFVIDEFALRAEMAFEALFGARDYVARVHHAKADGFGVLFRGIACRVLAEPSLRGSVAIFAAHTLGDFKGAASLLRGNWWRHRSPARYISPHCPARGLRQRRQAAD